MSKQIYKFTMFEKQKDNSYKKTSSFKERLSTNVGRWQRSAELDLEDAGYKTTLITKPTNSGLSTKVIKSTSIAPDGHKIIAELVKPKKKISEKQIKAIRASYAIRNNKNKRR